MIKTIVLDLDRTLIHAVPKIYIKDSIDLLKANFEHFEFEDLLIFLRPGVRQFINIIRTNFNVGIFTASDKDYSSFIVDKLFHQKDGTICPSFLFHSFHYEESFDTYGRLKPLEYVAEKEKLKIDECLIIDDSNRIKVSNGERCYKIPPFVVVFDDYPKVNDDAINDTYLEECLSYLINKDR